MEVTDCSSSFKLSLSAQGSRQRAVTFDRRSRNEEEADKRQKKDDGDAVTSQPSKPSVLPAPFSAEEIAADARKPKHKVVVMIGYSGSGYKGMQM